jgi:hypothetical protein
MDQEKGFIISISFLSSFHYIDQNCFLSTLMMVKFVALTMLIKT